MSGDGRLAHVLKYVVYRALQCLSLTPRRDLFLEEKYQLIRSHYAGPCLDVGSGYGDFAAFLQSAGLAVTAVDVADQGQQPDIEPQIFDGSTIPFPAQSFDTVIAMFVLHHAHDQLRLLAECGRVARRRIIVGEDVTETPVDKLLASIHLWSSPWGRARASCHSDGRWREIFDDLGWRLLTVVRIPRYKDPLYPINRRIYVIEAPALRDHASSPCR